MSKLEPELLANGDILVPIHGGSNTVTLKPGEDEHAEWLEYLQRPHRRPSRLRSPRFYALAGLATVVALAWSGGTFDEPLSHIGLNKNPCVKNAYGATFCGDDAKSYCQSVAAFHPPACAAIEQH